MHNQDEHLDNLATQSAFLDSLKKLAVEVKKLSKTSGLDATNELKLIKQKIRSTTKAINDLKKAKQALDDARMLLKG